MVGVEFYLGTDASAGAIYSRTRWCYRGLSAVSRKYFHVWSLTLTARGSRAKNTSVHKGHAAAALKSRW
jgi:hypothetical protein